MLSARGPAVCLCPGPTDTGICRRQVFISLQRWQALLHIAPSLAAQHAVIEQQAAPAPPRRDSWHPLSGQRC